MVLQLIWDHWGRSCASEEEHEEYHNYYEDIPNAAQIIQQNGVQLYLLQK
jgi:hypothetical protein